MTRDWLIIGLVVVVLWSLWLFFNFVADLFYRYRQARAAESSEDSTPTKGTGSSL